jgi:N4-gp56 family major capsid protein
MFRLRQLVDVKEAIGKGRGDTWLFDKAGNVAVQGGTLTETSTIPETSFVTNQGTGVIAEYGNSVGFTGKLQNLGQFEIDSTVEQKLRDDQVKVLESACGAEFVKTEFVAVCESTSSCAITTNGTATRTATADLNAYNVRQIVDFMKKKMIPKYDGRNYVCVASIQALSGMFADTAAGGWQDLAKYTPALAQQVVNGEVGNFYNTRFIEESGFLSNTIGASAVHGQAMFLGSDALYEAVCVPEEIRVKQSADYGRDLGLAWYALLGFKLVWAYATDAEQHVVFVTSA